MGEIDDLIIKVSPFYKKRKEAQDKGAEIRIPSNEYRLIYDSSSETLEPLYFWILDFMQKNFKKVEKLVDNFASSPGSGHFSELQGKASQMQQEASRVLGTVNNILKGVLNLIYDLKEFKIRLSHYEAADSKDKGTSEAGILALKQIWMDKVDMQRGQGSLNALSSGNLQFVTLRDAFMIVNSIKEVDDLDLNDRVKRILKPRIQEFFEWKERSHQELKKRYEIEKIYLKSQVSALKLNTRWAKPYLLAAQKLSQSQDLMSDAALVTAFNTIILQLTIVGIQALPVKEMIEDKKIPKEFRKMKNLREYNKFVVIDFKFRGIPSKSGQHYTFGGRADVEFKSYGLTKDEIEMIKLEQEKSDLKTAMSLVEGMTEGSLAQMQVDIDEILRDKKPGEKDEDGEDTNPFSAIFSIFKSEKKEDEKDEDDETKKQKKYEKLQKLVKKPENYAEKYLRNVAEAYAYIDCFNVYDIYKKGHGMPAFPFPWKDDKEAKAPLSTSEEIFGFGRTRR
jgi:hypothetical protein